LIRTGILISVYPVRDHNFQTTFAFSIHTPSTCFPRLPTFVSSGRRVQLLGWWLDFARGRIYTSWIASTDFIEKPLSNPNSYATKGNIHSSQTGNMLSGAPIASGGNIRSGTSMDQVVAQAISHQTKVPSLVLGCEKPIASQHREYSMLYSSHISWSSPTTLTPLELYPALAFDRLFKDNTATIADRSVLDAVHAQAKNLRNTIGYSDRAKWNRGSNEPAKSNDSKGGGRHSLHQMFLGRQTEFHRTSLNICG